MTPTLILIVLSILFAALAMVWPNYPLLAVAVILLAVSRLIGR